MEERDAEGIPERHGLKALGGVRGIEEPLLPGLQGENPVVARPWTKTKIPYQITARRGES